jgi:hypothetical protein
VNATSYDFDMGLEPVHDLCKDEEMLCFGELQGAKPKLEAGGLSWFCNAVNR